MLPLSCQPHIYLLISLHIPRPSPHLARQQFGPWEYLAVAGSGKWDTCESHWSCLLYSSSACRVIHYPFPHVSKKDNWIVSDIPHDCSTSWVWVPRCVSTGPLPQVGRSPHRFSIPASFLQDLFEQLTFPPPSPETFSGNYGCWA